MPRVIILQTIYLGELKKISLYLLKLLDQNILRIR